MSAKSVTTVATVSSASSPAKSAPKVVDIYAVDFLQYALGLAKTFTVSFDKVDFLIVGLDVEHYIHPPRTIMEISLPVLDIRNIAGRKPGVHGYNFLRAIKHNHLRIREMAQFRNNAPFADGYAKHDAFEFGKSEFVARSDVKDILTNILRVRDHQVPSAITIPAYRSVIIVGHAVKEDLDKVEKEFGFSFTDLGCIKHIIDLQLVAQRELRIPKPPSLRTIMTQLGFFSNNLHNAGNDATMQLICTIKLAVNAYHKSTGKKPVTIATTPQEIIGLVKNLARQVAATQQPLYGSHCFCIRCGADDHNNDGRNCPLRHIECQRCYSRRHAVVVCDVSDRFLWDRRYINGNANRFKDWIRQGGRMPAPYLY